MIRGKLWQSTYSNSDRQATFPCIHNWHPMEPLNKYREQIVDDVGLLVKVIDIVLPKYKEMANDQD